MNAPQQQPTDGRPPATLANSAHVFLIWVAVAVTIYAFVIFQADSDTTHGFGDDFGLFLFGLIYAAGFGFLALTVGPLLATGLLRRGMSAIHTGTVTFFVTAAGAGAVFWLVIMLWSGQ